MWKHTFTPLLVLCALLFVLVSAGGPSLAEIPAQRKSDKAQQSSQFAEELRQLQTRQKAEIQELHARHQAEKRALLQKYKGAGQSPGAGPGPGSERKGEHGQKPLRAEKKRGPKHLPETEQDESVESVEPGEARRPGKPPDAGEGKSKGHGGGPPPKDWKDK